MATLGRLTSAADIRQRCLTTDTRNGQNRTFLYCDSSLANMEAFARFQSSDWPYRRSSQQTERSDEFYQTPNYDAALKMCTHGWPEGTTKVKDMAMRLTPKIARGARHAYAYRPSVAPQGQYVINHVAAMAGSPAPFVGKFRTNEPVNGNKIIRIGFNAAVSCGVSADVIFARGAATLALVYTLERLGKTVDVTVFKCNSVDYFNTGGDLTLCQWHVKPAGARTNMDQLAFALCHASSLRRMLFTMLEHMPSDIASRLASSYGFPASLAENFPDVAAKYDVIVDSACMIPQGQTTVSAQWTNPEHQLAWVKDMLAKQGITG